MKKKYCVEFGKRGGYHTDSIVLITEKQARKLAASFVSSVDGWVIKGSSQADWCMTEGVFRKSWQGRTHFVAVTVLCDVFDDMVRGPASQRLWKLNSEVQGFKEEKRG